MALSRKLLFGLVGGISTAVVVIGTAVGVTVNKQNTVESGENNPDNSHETKPSEMGDGHKEEKINLNDVAKNLSSQVIEIKKITDNALSEEVLTQHSSYYPFDIVSKQLSLKQDALPNGIDATLNIDSNKNTAAVLNSGKLIIDINLKDSRDKTATKEVEITDFKKVDVSDFSEIIESNNQTFVLKIEQKQEEARYASVSFLNDQEVHIPEVPVIGARGARNMDLVRIRHQSSLLSKNEMGNGLTAWLKGSESKNSDKDLKLSGLVKVNKLSADKDKAYFHLVAKDVNSRIILSKGSGDNLKKIVLNEIKTTNLLPSDVSVFPTMLNREKTSVNLKALKALKNDDAKPQERKAYLTKTKDKALNRELSIKLMDDSDNDLLFIKPYVVDYPKGEREEDNVSLPLSVTVSFGEKDFASSFSTNNPEELKQLEEAGFKFDLFTKKLEGNDNPVPASKLTEKTLKTELEKYFKKDNYEKPIDRISEGNGAMKFTMKEVNENMFQQDLKISLMKETSSMNSINTLAFVDYSYKGIGVGKVLLTPSLSLIRIEANNRPS